MTAPLCFATARCLYADLNDLGVVLAAARRLHARTGDEHWAEQASRAQEAIDRREGELYGRSWVERVLARRPDGPAR